MPSLHGAGHLRTLRACLQPKIVFIVFKILALQGISISTSQPF